jgi:hypothetical protein
MHSDNFAGLLYANVQTLDIVVSQFFINNIGLADQHYGDLPLPGSHDSASYLMSGRIVPSHDINSNYGAITQK